MKTGWILYDRHDFEINRVFAEHVQEKGKRYGFSIEIILTENIQESFPALPEFVISRQRDCLLSAKLEAQGVQAYNCARVCEICNDKRNTHRFLAGLPMMRTVFAETKTFSNSLPFPLVVKPALGHGGDRVALVDDTSQLNQMLSAIHPNPAIVQETASGAGRDLRIYVLFGEIKAAVMRTAAKGIVSNFKRGGNVELHSPTAAEIELARQVIRRFAENGAPLSFAGIDFIYHHGSPVVNEVEDVVGSRMLYKVSEMDIADLFLQGIAARLR